MKTAINMTLLFFIALFMLQNHLLLALALVFIFTIRCSGAWLIPVAIALDGYFGAFTLVPIFSICVCAWFLASEYIKPRLLVQ